MSENWVKFLIYCMFWCGRLYGCIHLFTDICHVDCHWPVNQLDDHLLQWVLGCCERRLYEVVFICCLNLCNLICDVNVKYCIHAFVPLYELELLVSFPFSSVSARYIYSSVARVGSFSDRWLLAFCPVPPTSPNALTASCTLCIGHPIYPATTERPRPRLCFWWIIEQLPDESSGSINTINRELITLLSETKVPGIIIQHGSNWKIDSDYDVEKLLWKGGLWARFVLVGCFVSLVVSPWMC